MNKDNLLPFISTSNKQFWINTVNPANTDSVFLQHGMDNIDIISDYIRIRPNDLNIFNLFFHSNYLLKDEYLIAYSNNIVLTNCRLFIWYSDFKVIIPINNLEKYEKATWDTGIKVQYYLNGGIQKFSLTNAWVLPEIVNNCINRHGNQILLEEENILISSFKATLKSKYSILTDNDSEPSIEAEKIKVNNLLTEQFSQPTNPSTVPLKRQVNYRIIAVMLFFICSFGGCYYMISSETTSINYNTSNQYCSKHGVTYSPNNAYGGCPKCSNEKFAKDAAVALERKIYGNIGNRTSTKFDYMKPTDNTPINDKSGVMSESEYHEPITKNIVKSHDEDIMTSRIGPEKYDHSTINREIKSIRKKFYGINYKKLKIKTILPNEYFDADRTLVYTDEKNNVVKISEIMQGANIVQTTDYYFSDLLLYFKYLSNNGTNTNPKGYECRTYIYNNNIIKIIENGNEVSCDEDCDFSLKSQPYRLLRFYLAHNY